MAIEVIDIEIMTEDEITAAVDEAVQKASHGDTVMFDWLFSRARVFGGRSEGQQMLMRALERVRQSVG